MEEYKRKFIEYLLKTGALEVGKDRPLKSNRMSPWFVNIGDFNDGESTTALGEFYADSIIASGIEFDLLFGIPDKAIVLAGAVSQALYKKGKNVPWFFTRKVPKDYGEASSAQLYEHAASLKDFIEATQKLSKSDRIKVWVTGRAPKDGNSILQIDDVFTAGDAKYEARELLDILGDFRYPGLAIAVDRQEVGYDGKSAIEEYERKTGTNVTSIVNAELIHQYLKENAPVKTPFGEITAEHVKRMENYLRVYGTKQIRSTFENLEQKIIQREKSVIPACDVDTIEKFEDLVKQTHQIEGIGGYKVGFELALGYGLEKVVQTARKFTEKPIIYDHQKAATDIPETGKNFARVCKKAGVDAVILFPQAGPETERAWIYHCLDAGLNIIVGGRMTHPTYAQSEGGFITDEGALEMYRIAARAGINNFVVPGNKLDVIALVKEKVEAEGVTPVFYAPGFVAQGGKIGDAAAVAGDYWHAIVGRGIFAEKDMKEAAELYTSQL